VAVAYGGNCAGQCDLTAPQGGLTHTHIAAGGCHTVLLRSDGTAVAHGEHHYGQCDLLPLDEGRSYTATLRPALILQAVFDSTTASLCFVSLGGNELCRIGTVPSDQLAMIHVQLVSRVEDELGSVFSKVDALLPSNELLGDVSPEATVASVFGQRPN
jgi:hypothetical protein